MKRKYNSPDVVYFSKNEWTCFDDNVLRESYKLHNINYLCELFPTRTKTAIRNRIAKLKLKKDYSYNISKEFLLQEYIDKRKTTIEIGKETGLSKYQICKLLKQYNIKIDKTNMCFGSFHPHWKGYEEISISHFNAIKKSAKKRKIKFNLKIKDIWHLFVQQNRICKLSGTKLVFAKKAENWYKETTASLDRINSSKDYTIDNVQWIHKDINRMKMDLDENNFINWCEIISKYRKDKH